MYNIFFKKNLLNSHLKFRISIKTYFRLNLAFLILYKHIEAQPKKQTICL